MGVKRFQISTIHPFAFSSKQAENRLMNKKILSIFFALTLVFTGCASPSNSEKAVKLYYYNSEMDKDANGNILCSNAGLQPVERKITASENYIGDTISLLLTGALTPEERSSGLTTEYPLEGFGLKTTTLDKGVLTLEFSDPNNKTSGGSCRVAILWAQIEATAKQFPEVKEVSFKPEELFQP